VFLFRLFRPIFITEIYSHRTLLSLLTTESPIAPDKRFPSCERPLRHRRQTTDRTETSFFVTSRLVMKTRDGHERIMSKGNDEDEEDLETLRLAALENLRAKGLPLPILSGLKPSPPVIPQVVKISQ